MYGKHLSDETKNKISNKIRGGKNISAKALQEKYKDLELIETTNNIAKGYVVMEGSEFSPSQIQEIFTKSRGKCPDSF